MRTHVPFLSTMGALCLAGCGQQGQPAPPIDVSLAVPEHGFQLATDEADIPSGEEWQACYFFKVPEVAGGQPFYASRIEIAQNVGSHHMNIFRQGTVLAPDPMNPNVGLKGPNPDGTGVVISKNGSGPCFYSANWADWPLVVNSQQPTERDDKGNLVNYVLDLSANPRHDNVAYKFTPGEVLMLQSHFVNATTQVTPGRAKAIANFYQLTDTTAVQEVATLFATKQSIAVCRDDPTPSFSGFCTMPSATPLTIVAANGHFHSRGTDFTIATWDGKTLDPAAGSQFYESTRWDEPPMATALFQAVPAGGGVTWTCTYQWAPSPACADGCSCIKEPKGRPASDCCYGFGGIVETSEHCNAFVYYYPKSDIAVDKNCM